MSLSLAWVTPFGPRSDVGAFSRNLLQEFQGVAESLDLGITVFVNENGPRYWTSLPCVALTGTDADRELLLGHDLVVFNIGNNAENHGHINRLALTVPGVIIVHDLVMQHAFAGMLRAASGGHVEYALLMGACHGAPGLAAVARSGLCRTEGEPQGAPWDATDVAAFPLIAPHIATAAAVVVHSAYAEAAITPVETTPVLRLALPHDQKPSLTDAEWQDWARETGSGPCRFVAIGHISRSKCLDQPIQAFADSAWLRGHATLTIAGHADDAACAAALQLRVAQQGLSDCVTFHFSQSVAELLVLKRRADVFVNLRHPHTEGASGSLVEQLNAGKPVVVYPTGVYAELPAGAAIPVDRAAGAAGLTLALEAIATDPAARSRIGAAGRVFARRIGRAEYVDRLWTFLCAHRRLLQARLSFSAARRHLPGIAAAEVGTAWLAGVVATRRILAGRGLAVETLPFQAWDDAMLACHIAVVLFGQPVASPLEALLREELPGSDRAAWYEATAEALLLLRVCQTPGLPHGLDTPVLLPQAWRMLACLGRWTLIGCCYAGLLGRIAQPDEIAQHCINATATLKAVADVFTGSAEFAGRGVPAATRQTLQDGLAAADVVLAPIAMLPADSSVAFTANNPDCELYLAPGWHHVEAQAVWSRRSDAIVLFRSDPSGPGWLEVSFRLLVPTGSARSLQIHVDGAPGLSHRIASSDWTKVAVPIPSQPSGGGGHVVYFDCGHTVAPCDIGLGDDTRQLGFCLRSLRLTATPPAPSEGREDPVTKAMALFDHHVAAMTRDFAGSDFDPGYYTKHRARFAETVRRIPPGTRAARALEIGATAVLQVALAHTFGYGEVVGTEYSSLIEHKIYRKRIEIDGHRVDNLTISVDVESDILPFPEAYFDLVTCCEVIEHLDIDPMFMVAELNRILRPGGTLLLTTPNSCSGRNLWKIAHGVRPHFFMQYTRDRSPYRHNMEYDSHALTALLRAGGFTIAHLSTHDVFEPTLPEALALIARNQLPDTLRGDDIFILAHRSGPVTDRWPVDVYV